MTESSQPKKSSRWLRRVGIVLGSLLALLVVAYFVVTSSSFITGFVLPRAGRALHADLTAQSVSLSPFSQVDIHGLKLEVPGNEPILEAPEVKSRYDLWKILRGNITAEEVTIDSPTINYVQNADGSRNIDALLSKPSATTSSPAPAGKPTVFDVHNITLKNATLHATIKSKNGAEQHATISGLNLTLDQFVTGQPSKLALALAAQSETFDAKTKSTQLDGQANIESHLDFALDQNLMPKSAQGSFKVELPKVGGSLANLTGLSVLIDADVTPTDIKKLSLRVMQKETPLGTLTISGPLDSSKKQGRLAVDLSGIDGRLLALTGGAGDYNFNQSSVSLHSDLDLGANANAIKATGLLKISRLSVSSARQNFKTPILDLALDYGVDVDQAAQSAKIEKLSLSGSEDGQPFLTTSLSQPMALAWGAGAQPPEAASLAMVITNFDIAHWKPLLGKFASQGKVNARLNLATQGANKNMSTQLSFDIADLTTSVGTNQISGAGLDLSLNGQLANLEQLTADKFKIDLALAGQPALSLGAQGGFNLKTKAMAGSVSLSGSLPLLLKFAPPLPLNLTEGSVSLEAKTSGSPASPNINATLTLKNLSGQAGALALKKASVTLTADTRLSGSALTINQATVQLDQAGQKLAQLEAKGDYDLAKKSGQIDLSVDDSLPPTLSLMPSASLNLTSGHLKVAAKINTAGASQSLKGSIALSQISGTVAGAPLNDAALNLDADVKIADQIATINKIAGTITQAGRPGGRINLSGSYGLTNKTGQMNLDITGLNEQALGPFLASALSQKKLQTIDIESKSSARFDATGALSVKSDTSISNLVVQDLKTGSPQPPLATKLHLDADMAGQKFDLHSLVLSMTPTARGANTITAKGQLDLSAPQSINGNIDLNAASIDVTPFYDLYASRAKSAASPAGATSPVASPAQAGPQKEPDPVKLPVGLVKAQAEIGAFYLRDIAISNFQFVAQVRQSQADISDLKFSLNGAPVAASVSSDLSVPGYKYKLKLKGEKIPLAPLANSFEPDNKGRYNGDIIAEADISGAGTTGVNLKKSLEGKVFFALTNADIKFVSPRMQTLLTPVALLLRVPEIAQSPLHYANFRTDLGGGNIDCKDVTFETTAFVGHTSGVIPIADILTNSPLQQLPVDFLLARGLAKRSALLGANTPADAAFVKLPNFLKLKGTLGTPKADISEMALAGILARSTTGILTQPVGGLLRGVDNALTGGGSGGSPTNAPSTNSPGLLQGVKGLFGK